MKINPPHSARPARKRNRYVIPRRDPMGSHAMRYRTRGIEWVRSEWRKAFPVKDEVARPQERTP